MVFRVDFGDLINRYMHIIKINTTDGKINVYRPSTLRGTVK